MITLSPALHDPKFRAKLDKLTRDSAALFKI
jgi:hypothetical protein